MEHKTLHMPYVYFTLAFLLLFCARKVVMRTKKYKE